MKKLILGFILLFAVLPIVTLAAGFERDLYYGIYNDADVTRLQEFLLDQKVYDGPVTGNFFSLTIGGVKRFQEKEGIAPPAGYFGPKTRARANEILTMRAAETPSASPPASVSEQVVLLLAKIKELQDQIKTLSAATSSLPVSPIVVTPEPLSPSSPPVSPTSAPVLEVSGSGDQQFPATPVASLKIGDIVIRNNTSDKIPFSQIIMDVTDQMNSSINRGHEVFFILRKGTTTADDVLSRTSFKFNSNVPQPDSPHRSQVGLPYDVVINAGDAQTLGLWIDSLEYVIGGTLKFEFRQFLAPVSSSPVGGFSFTFRRD